MIMTRTSQDVDITNVARAQIANEAHADLFVRVHADGSDNSSTTASTSFIRPRSKAGPTTSRPLPRRRHLSPRESSSPRQERRTGASTRAAT